MQADAVRESASPIGQSVHSAITHNKSSDTPATTTKVQPNPRPTTKAPAAQPTTKRKPDPPMSTTTEHHLQRMTNARTR